MADWSDGYVTEIQYTGQYYPELSPGFLAFACLRQSVRPPEIAAGSSYLELGCGQGFGLNLLAAANPTLQFVGVDFNPGQIANANRLAAEAGLPNVTFDDLSFAQLLALPEGRLPKFDVISLHGVYSWVSAENQQAIVQIIDRLLKPGGVVYVSYNCLPGSSANLALQRFIQSHVAQSSGEIGARIVAALTAAQQMQEGGALYFESAPSLKLRVSEALKRPPEYLVHEYLNIGAEPLFHADVARQMEGARLSLAASANAAEDFVHLAAPAPLRPAIEAATDPTWRQTLLDYASNKIFRRDIFVRGRNVLPPREHANLLETARFGLLVPADSVTLDTPVPLGALRGDPNIYRPIIEALRDGPKSFGELIGRPDLAGARQGAVLQAIAMLIGRRQIHPLAPEWDGTPALAFNRALLARLAHDETPSWLAAPAIGSGVHLEFEEMLAAHAVLNGEEDMSSAVQRGWEIMQRTRRRLLKEGVVLEDPAANRAELVERMARFKATQLPLLRSLGVL